MGRTLLDYAINNRYTRPVRIAVERRLFALRTVRALVNRAYNATDMEGRRDFFQRSAKIYRDYNPNFGQSVWTLNVPPFRLRMPLRSEYAWLDWDSALASLAHDHEVKEFYAQLLGSQFRPDIFVDVGANYGTHSALFLSAGVRVVAFEPNPDCKAYFDLLLELNGFQGARWEQVALGDAVRTASLSFPEMDTWLGKVQPGHLAESQSGGMTVITVPVQRLDDMNIQGERCFVKIDTEGSELHVIRGGHSILADRCTFFIFESNQEGGRKELFAEINSLGFCIEPLPVREIHESRPLAEGDFIAATGSNFLARNRKALTHAG